MEKIQGVAQKTMSKGKDKLDDVMLQKRLSKLYRQLGTLVYSQHESGHEDRELLKSYFTEISRVKALMESIHQPGYEASAEDGVSIITCGACGAEDSEGAMFCSRCGEKLPRS